jgi:Phage integrase family
MAGNLQVRLLLSVGYGAGLRVSEVVKLKVKHIDSSLGIIRIEQAKGKKARHVMLSSESCSRSCLSGGAYGPTTMIWTCRSRNADYSPGGARARI